MIIQACGGRQEFARRWRLLLDQDDPVGLSSDSNRRVSNEMSDATVMLAAVERGEPKAPDQLLTLVYDELRRLAAC
jgi:hypothetical protein